MHVKPKKKKINIRKSQTYKGKITKTKQLGIISGEKPISRRDITLKAIRAYDVNRATKILRLIPKFINFYKKLEPMQIAAVKYYKGAGSFFQSKILADYNTANTKNKTARELLFPFPKGIERLFYRDILGKQKLESIYELDLPSAANFDKYIDQSYGKRVELLNHLDTVYDRSDCPKLTGEEILFRGMHNVNPDIKKLKPGDTYLFKNFIYTTIDRQIADRYTGGDTMFVLTGLKDIPFVYMPNDKHRGEDSYHTFMTDQYVYGDISEFTLPRNLEFEITNIESRFLSNGWFSNTEPIKFSQLLKTMRNRGLTSEEDVVEDKMYPKCRFIFARFKSWLPREPIDFDKIKKDAKFVLSKGALATWRNKDEDDD